MGASAGKGALVVLPGVRQHTLAHSVAAATPARQMSRAARKARLRLAPRAGRQCDGGGQAARALLTFAEVAVSFEYGWRTQAFIAVLAVVGVGMVTAFSLTRKSEAPAPIAQKDAKEQPSLKAPKVQAEPEPPQPPAEAEPSSQRWSAGEPSIDRVALRRALDAAAASAKQCRAPHGPTGLGKVGVTFANSGRVIQAKVWAPPYVGTPVGACVAAVFQRAQLPAFVGDAVTVSKSFSIEPE